MKPSEYLKKRNWIKGEMYEYNEEGERIGCCLLGAIHQGVPTTAPGENLIRFKRELVNVIDYHSIPGWNDNIAKDREEVILKLEEVERRLRL